MAFDLRPYQLTALDKLRHSLAGGHKRVMLYSPTGSGKTEIGMAMIRSAIAKGKRVVFLCNRIGLVSQASRRFALAGIPHGVIQGDNTRDTHCSVIVASIQTIARRGMPDCDLIVIDEAHAVAGSKDFRSVIIERNLVPVIGLSATPFSKGLGKHNDALRGPLFQALVVAATIPELIAANFLVDCDIYAPSDPDMSGVKTARNAFGELDFSDADVGRAVDKPTLIGDIVTHWLRLAKDTPTVCFAANIAHSRHIVESFRAAGVAAEHVDCYTPEEERVAILDRVSSGETTVVSNVGILTEGWDFPACKTMILARPTRSLIRYIQMAGRVLRIHESKKRALILDHSGTVTRLGFPVDDFLLELDDGKPNTSGQQERQKPEPKACPKCKFVRPAGVHTCPSCGFEPQRQSEVETAEGELVKLDRKNRKSATPDRKQHAYSQLLMVARNKGYSSGWVSHKYREMFGVWPRGMRDVPAAPTTELLNWLKSQQIRYAKGKQTQQEGRAHG